ncbi:hypothetical protein DIPPA_25220 [Diplonema papillatum]|nr:hypothetical protein DIPPA_25220 [Diplonema papillatum]
MTNGSHSPPPLLEEGDDEGARRRSSFMPSPRALLQALKLTQGSISPKAMQTMTVFASMNQDNHDPVTTPAPLKSEHPIYRAPTRHDTNISFNSDGMSSQVCARVCVVDLFSRGVPSCARGVHASFSFK